ncbi:MAG: hypothetical protein OXM02_14290 [Bacteroidota bacterium]|nr:hypothetical protein [Bacteroidota bacterium]
MDRSSTLWEPEALAEDRVRSVATGKPDAIVSKDFIPAETVSWGRSNNLRLAFRHALRGQQPWIVDASVDLLKAIDRFPDPDALSHAPTPYLPGDPGHDRGRSRP